MTIPLNDDPAITAWFHEQWQSSPDIHTLVDHVLSNTTLWQQDLSQIVGLTDLLTTYLADMDHNGIQSAIEHFNG